MFPITIARIGSFFDASCNALIPIFFVTPFKVNITSPGLTLHIKCFTLPAPLPILEPIGLDVMGVFGLILMYRAPVRLVVLVITRLAASICQEFIGW
jgi:hypothetical protein